MIIFNRHSQPISQVVRIPYYSKQATVTNFDGSNARFEVSENSSWIQKYRYLQIVEIFNISTLNSKLRAPYELYVSVKVPALGHITLNVDGVKSNDR